MILLSKVLLPFGTGPELGICCLYIFHLTLLSFTSTITCSSATKSAISLRTVGCNVIRPQRLLDIQPHEVVLDLVQSYSGRDFEHLTPT